jgi:hypothetical protein
MQCSAVSFLKAAMDDIRYASRLGGPAIGPHPISLALQDLDFSFFVVE